MAGRGVRVCTVKASFAPSGAHSRDATPTQGLRPGLNSVPPLTGLCWRNPRHHGCAGSEQQFQGELDQPRVAGLGHLTEG